MLSSLLAGMYTRDLNKFADEINLFANEDNLWKTAGTINNSAGNLALHIAGGLNYLIGNLLAHTGYVRNREAEFTAKGVAREELVAGLKNAAQLVEATLQQMTDEDMRQTFPIPFDGSPRSNSYILVQMLTHLNYHLGQVNYLRRVLQ